MKKFLILLLVLALALPVSAQTAQPEPPHPLLQLLGLIPDTADNRADLIGYSDFRAAEQAFPAAGQYDSWADVDTESTEFRLWQSALPGSGAPDLYIYIRQAGSFPDVMGFDLFDIDNAIFFGTPPSVGQILMGDFDADAITASREARDYEQTEINGFPAWCWIEGCDQGDKANISEVDHADIFGGGLGRHIPVVLADSFMFGSSNLATVEAVTEAYTGEVDSLADNPTYVAAAESLTMGGLLRQVMFIPPRQIDIDIMNFDAVTEELANFEEFGKLPFYRLLVLADVATGENQHAVVALVYDDVEDANAAAEIIPARLEITQSLVANRPFLDTLEAELEEPVVFENPNGKAVLLLTFTYPPASDALDEDGRVIERAGAVYGRLYNALVRRDLLWLIVE